MITTKKIMERIKYEKEKNNAPKYGLDNHNPIKYRIKKGILVNQMKINYFRKLFIGLSEKLYSRNKRPPI